mmetsp:Transcript_31623/g.60969  ORF Transcript_31623/g.60969 Transcript_31623/m.60969 type:complete len:219 (+) Transcript_31623:76-732(+)
MLRQAVSRFGQQARLLAPPARSFASASEEAIVAAPLKQFGIAGRYSAALYSAASKKKNLEKVEQELLAVSQMADTNIQFKSFLSDPTMSKTKKTAAVMALMEELKMSETTKCFFGVLAENGRLPETTRVTKLFSELMMASRGEVSAVVTSADPLSAKELADVAAACKATLEAGKTLKLSQKVDASIIGGLIIDIGDKHMDLSINTKIRKIENLLAEAL